MHTLNKYMYTCIRKKNIWKKICQFVYRRNSRRVEWQERGKGDSYVAFYYGVTSQMNLCKFYDIGKRKGERMNTNK